jgi:PKD-like domain/Secretion system C-terminal sorting domain/SprB repeat
MIVPGAFLSDNFEVTYGLGDLIITPAPLTVTALDDSALCNNVSSLGFTITGYQYTDSAANVVSLIPTLNVYDSNNVLASLQNMPGGNYTIKPSGLQLFNPANYTPFYVNGSLYVAPQLSLDAAATQPLCFNAKGSVLLTPSGGTSPYTLSGDATANLNAGTYNYLVTDSKGCTASASAIINAAPAQLVLNATVTQPTCFGTTGSVQLSATGGTGNYTFSNTPTSGLSGGTYNYQVSDANGCVATKSVLINNAPALLVASASVTAPSCLSGQGTVLVSAVGGSTPYSGTGSFTVNASTAYSFTVTDNKGCTSTVSGVMPNAVPVSVNAGANATICAGSNVTLTATGNAATYFWTPGNLYGASISVHPSITTVYTVLATSASGCTATSTVTVNVTNALPAKPGAISGPSNGICSTNGLVYSISSVAGATSYQWVVPAGMTIVNGQGTTSITVNVGAIASSCAIQVRSVNGCGKSEETKLYVTAKPQTPSSIAGPVNGICQQQNVNYTIQPVVGATTYNWSVPAGVSILSGQGSTSLFVKFNSSFTGSGTISVTAANSCGASSARSLTVIAKPATPTVINAPSSICKNQSGLVFSTPAIPGATFYTWTFPSGVIIQSGANTNTVTVKFGTKAGTVKVAAANACGSNSYKSISVAFSCREANPDLTSDLFKINVFPNPSKGMVNVEFNADADEKGTLKVLDFTGHTLIAKNIDVQDGANNFEIDLSAIASGVYMVVLETPEQPVSFMRIFKD